MTPEAKFKGLLRRFSRAQAFILCPDGAVFVAEGYPAALRHLHARGLKGKVVNREGQHIPLPATRPAWNPEYFQLTEPECKAIAKAQKAKNVAEKKDKAKAKTAEPPPAEPQTTDL